MESSPGAKRCARRTCVDSPGKRRKRGKKTRRCHLQHGDAFIEDNSGGSTGVERAPWRCGASATGVDARDASPTRRSHVPRAVIVMTTHAERPPAIQKILPRSEDELGGRDEPQGEKERFNAPDPFRGMHHTATGRGTSSQLTSRGIPLSISAAAPSRPCLGGTLMSVMSPTFSPSSRTNPWPSPAPSSSSVPMPDPPDGKS